MGEDFVTLDIVDVRSFLRQVLADSPDLFEWIDDRALNAETFRALLELAREGDPEIEVTENGHVADSAHLQVILGRRFHLKLRSAAWQLALGVLPVIISGVMASTTPADAATVVGAAISVAVANTKRLDRAEWPLLRFVQQLGNPTRGDVLAAAKQDGISKANAERLLERLIAANVIEESEGRLRIVE